MSQYTGGATDWSNDDLIPDKGRKKYFSSRRLDRLWGPPTGTWR
jgi:hypothetical protein